VFIGVGAGISPFRAIMNEKVIHIMKGKEMGFGDITVFFGCRRDNEDFIFYSDFQISAMCKGHKDLHVAFSRSDKVPKSYVQDQLKTHWKKVFDVVFKQKGKLYVCGSRDMEKQVLLIVRQICDQ